MHWKAQAGMQHGEEGGKVETYLESGNDAILVALVESDEGE
jgi:hypothetical protein